MAKAPISFGERQAATRERMTPSQKASFRSAPFVLDVGMPPPAAAEGGMAQFENPKTLQEMIGLPGVGRLQGAPADQSDDDFYENLADKINPNELQKCAEELIEALERDERASDDQDAAMARGIAEMGMDRTRDVRDEPFPGASGVVHPMLPQAVVEFASRAMAELMPPSGPVRPKVLGQQTDEKVGKAERVANFMNWQLTEQCPEYRSEFEKMLMILGFTGDCVRKLYWDDDNGRPRSEFVSSDLFVVPYGTTDLETCPRYGHKMFLWPDTVQGYMASGLWRDVTLPEPSQQEARRSKSREKADAVTQSKPSLDDRDAQYQFVEYHADRYFESLGPKQFGNPEAESLTGDEEVEQPDDASLADLTATAEDGEGDMVALPGAADGEANEEQTTTGTSDTSGGSRKERPFIITIERSSKTVVAVRRNWKKEDEKARKRVWFQHYIMFPWTGFKGIGLWHMIGGLARGATGALRALMDSAQIANLPSGLRLKGSRTSGTVIKFRPLDLVEIDAPGATDIRQVAMPLPFNGPSTVLFELLGFLVQNGSRFASVALQNIAEANPQMPVGTTLALIEEGGRVYNAIHSRLHFAQKKEIQLLAELNFDNLDNEVIAQSFGGEQVVTREDFGGNVGITAVSDPAVSNQLQRTARSDALLSLVLKAAEVGVDADKRLAFKNAAKNLGAEDAASLFPEPKKAVPLDPVSELMALTRGEPVDAFPGQNHEAHVAFLRGIAKNPQYEAMAQSLGPRLASLGMAHLVHSIKDKITKAIGQQIPEGQQVPPEVQSQIADLVAKAAQQLPDTDMFGTTPDDANGMAALMITNQTAREEIQAEQIKAVIKAGTERDIAEAKLGVEREIRMWDLMVKLVIEYAKAEGQDDREAAAVADRISTRTQGMMMEVVKLMSQREESEKDRRVMVSRRAQQ